MIRKSYSDYFSCNFRCSFAFFNFPRNLLAGGGSSLSVRSFCEKNCLIFKQEAEFSLISCLVVAKCFWGHLKSTFARNFQLLTPVPPGSFLFVLHVPSPSTYVRLSELHPPPSQKKFRKAYDAYFE